MSDLQRSLNPAAALRTLVVTAWLAGGVLLATLLACVLLPERQRELARAAEHGRALVSAALMAELSEDQRQALISSYGLIVREELNQGLNVLMVVDQSGRVVHSTRPAWRQLLITDPVFSQPETDDPDIRAVIACFRRLEGDCISLRSESSLFHPGRFSVVRPALGPILDPGRRRERFLVIANVGQGLLSASLLLDLLLCLTLALLLSGLMALLLWLLLAAYLLPRLLDSAQTDALTELMTRGLFMDLAKETLAEAEGMQSDLVFAILDIDHFKRINDTYGHGCGDEALRHVAEIFRAVLRAEDLFCRFGGEEFAMLFLASREQAARALERLRLQLEMSALLHRGQRLTIQASIGAVATRECGYNLDYLYSAADQALYQAKRAGRNRIAWSEGRAVSRLAP